MKTTLCIAIFLALAAPANAGTPQWGAGEVRLRACGLHTVKTEPIPAKAVFRRIRVFARGAEIEGQAEGPRRAHWVGRGVAIVGQAAAREAPLVFRVANLSTRGCGPVRIVYRWTQS